MALEDIKISEAIVRSFSEKLVDVLDNDVAIVGAGPAGLTAAYYLAAAGKRVAVFERKLSIGGGMWGGGIMFNEIVVQAEGKALVEEFGVRTREVLPGYFACDSVEAVTTIASAASRAGARIMNLFSVEDVLMVGEAHARKIAIHAQHIQNDLKVEVWGPMAIFGGRTYLGDLFTLFYCPADSDSLHRFAAEVAV